MAWQSDSPGFCSSDPEAITIDADTAQIPEIEWYCTRGTGFIDLTLKKEGDG